jgi:Mg2+ and Co2+ transporter CorA
MNLLENKCKENMSTNETKDIIDIKVDVGVLKTQTSILSTLCEKMDKVIEKLVDNHDKHIGQLYQTIEDRRSETDDDVKELHERIDDVLEKVTETEKSLLEEIKTLRGEMSAGNKSQKEKLDQILQWRWMIIGGIVATTWLISHLSPDIIKNFFK